VAELTVGLAEAVNLAQGGPFGGVFFTDQQLREIRYASLLHDFGKVGVREEVLVKSKKLEASRLELLLQRLRQRQQEELLAVLRSDWEAGLPFDLERWSELATRHEAETGRFMELLIRSNEPSVLSEEVAAGLGCLGALRFTTRDGAPGPVLAPSDMDRLNIRRGSLSESERLEIETHVTHTYEFLKKIPWTPDLALVPDIAYAHHERINGQGYPRRLRGEDILLQSKAMAITDIFDALTAQDRPYKAALPLARSLDILAQDAREGHVDADLLHLFIEARVFERTLPGPG
jgi:response regulator RpfG family c-di-GMP phosphodiesterase